MIEILSRAALEERMAGAAERLLVAAVDLFVAELSSGDDAPDLVALDGDTLAGAVWVNRYRHPTLGREVAELDVVVAPAYRRRGVASRLAQAARAVEDAAGRVVVARPWTPEGTGLVEALGMRPTKHPEYWSF